MAYRKCTECGAFLEGANPKKVTCSANCRSARSRRIARNRKRGAKRRAATNSTESGEMFAGLADADAKVEDAVRDVVREELRPVVRESITEDTLRAIQNLVALTPLMVDALAHDLQDTDPVVRQKAYTLGMRYTLGHQAIVKPEEGAAGNKMVVVFDGMPRQGDADPEPVEVLATEIRNCNGCDQDKPAAEFVGASDRCNDCHAELKRKAESLLGSTD